MGFPLFFSATRLCLYFFLIFDVIDPGGTEEGGDQVCANPNRHVAGRGTHEEHDHRQDQARDHGSFFATKVVHEMISALSKCIHPLRIC